MTVADTGPIPAGTLVAHYEVRRILGKGGMGTVYLAHDTSLDRPVALKILRTEVADDSDVRDRFVREARAAARVSHPNLTHVYFVGERDGKPFFAMEYCPGSTLEAEVAEKGPLSLELGLDFLVQAARGLESAHRAGVVHRDVKPSNLMVLPDGNVKVTDFGLAKSLRGDVEATGGGRILGTPTYISPEQCRGKEIDARTDIYLLGLTAWFLFTGKPAFASDQLAEVIHAQMSEPLPPLREARPDLPPALEGVLGRMCAKSPAERPATMEEVIALLDTVRPRLLAPAPFLARAVAFGFDIALLTLFYVAGGALFLLVLRGGALLETVFSLVMLGPTFFLLLYPEVRWGTTVGKSLMNLAVVRNDGTAPSFRILFLRLLIRVPAVVDLIPTEGGGLGAVSMVIWFVQGLAILVGIAHYFLRDGRSLSDVLTGTRIVYRLGLPGTGRPDPTRVPPGPTPRG